MKSTTEIRTTDFVVTHVSNGTNSFGLRGMLLLSASGIGYEVAANSLNVRSVGDVLEVKHVEGCEETFSFAPLGFEIPRRLINIDQQKATKLIKAAKAKR